MIAIQHLILFLVLPALYSFAALKVTSIIRNRNAKPQQDK
jgi:hypothetical protein